MSTAVEKSLKMRNLFPKVSTSRSKEQIICTSIFPFNSYESVLYIKVNSSWIRVTQNLTPLNLLMLTLINERWYLRQKNINWNHFNEKVKKNDHNDVGQKQHWSNNCRYEEKIIIKDKIIYLNTLTASNEAPTSVNSRRICRAVL